MAKTLLKARLVKIGNSQGIRLPKPLLDQVGLAGEVELEVREDGLVIRPVRERARAGWDEQFAAMAECGDDHLLDGDLPSFSRWDADDWEW